DVGISFGFLNRPLQTFRDNGIYGVASFGTVNHHQRHMARRALDPHGIIFAGGHVKLHSRRLSRPARSTPLAPIILWPMSVRRAVPSLSADGPRAMVRAPLAVRATTTPETGAPSRPYIVVWVSSDAAPSASVTILGTGPRFASA